MDESAKWIGCQLCPPVISARLSEAACSRLPGNTNLFQICQGNDSRPSFGCATWLEPLGKRTCWRPSRLPGRWARAAPLTWAHRLTAAPHQVCSSPDTLQPLQHFASTRAPWGRDASHRTDIETEIREARLLAESLVGKPQSQFGTKT